MIFLHQQPGMYRGRGMDNNFYNNSDVCVCVCVFGSIDCTRVTLVLK